MDDLHVELDRLHEERDALDALRAENARLREALTFAHTVLSDPVSEAVRYNAWKVALAGLEGPEAIRGLR